MIRSNDCAVVWTPEFVRHPWTPYHPMNPIRLDLTMALASELGILDGVSFVAPVPTDDSDLLRAHTSDYIDAVKRAPADLPAEDAAAFGLGTDENPVFADMHEAGSIIVGGTLRAAREVAAGRTKRAVSISGGMHHAMPASAAGFCLYNDITVAISWLLDNGFDRIAYIDVDVHHGDGVQQAFEDDPRVITISIHQDPETLWPCTGHPSEVGSGVGAGAAVNVSVPPGAGDALWLRAFHAVVPDVVAAFKPQIIVSQCGADTHREDPLAELELTIDGQRAAFHAIRDLADTHADGRWIATGGGGYDLIRVVSRAWTHLLATVLGRDIDVSTPLPPAWRERVRAIAPDVEVPETMGDYDADVDFLPWDGPVGTTDDGDGFYYARTDAAILETRSAVFPLLGIDPGRSA